jgi:hypothetical protein
LASFRAYVLGPALTPYVSTAPFGLAGALLLATQPGEPPLPCGSATKLAAIDAVLALDDKGERVGA